MNRPFIFITFLLSLLAARIAVGQATFLLNETELIEQYGENDAYTEAK